jgi:hypothetical protein
MNSRSPTLEGFRAVFRQPSLGFAEIAWRWSFGSAAGLLITLAGFEYLDTLPVTGGDLLLLRSRQPVLISKAVGHIVRGSGFRLVEAFIVLGLGLAAGWIVVAALARSATIRDLLTHFRESDASSKPGATWRLNPIIGLNFLRTAATLAAVVGGFAGFMLGALLSTGDKDAPNGTLLIGIIVAGLVWLAWSVVNWFLSLAAIFVVANGQDAFGSIANAVDFLRQRIGPMFAVGVSFGLAHTAAFVLAGVAAAFLLGLATISPAWVLLAALITITLLYFAVADFLYMGRLAAYVAILELPEPSFQPSALSIQPGGSVDPYELILSDMPPPLET